MPYCNGPAILSHVFLFASIAFYFINPTWVLFACFLRQLLLYRVGGSECYSDVCTLEEVGYLSD